MLKGFDVSHWEPDFEPADANGDFIIVKATQGIGYVDKSCDKFVESCKQGGKLWGFYHYADSRGTATQQARHFYERTKGYVRGGIPILDFEEKLDNGWIDEFVKEYHAITHVYPWVYLSSNFINSLGYGSDFVKAHCGLWLAGYPKAFTTWPSTTQPPYRHRGWQLVAWQFTSSFPQQGYKVDANYFYGNAETWAKYVAGDNKTALNQGWAQVADSWYWYIDGQKATGWQKIADDWYWFDAQGRMISDGFYQLVANSGIWYCFNKNGQLLHELPSPDENGGIVLQ